MPVGDSFGSPSRWLLGYPRHGRNWPKDIYGQVGLPELPECKEQDSEYHGPWCV